VPSAMRYAFMMLSRTCASVALFCAPPCLSRPRCGSLGGVIADFATAARACRSASRHSVTSSLGRDENRYDRVHTRLSLCTQEAIQMAVRCLHMLPVWVVRNMHNFTDGTSVGWGRRANTHARPNELWP